MAPSLTHDERVRHWCARYERLAIGPGVAAATYATMFDILVRHILPAIRVPTLVLHRSGDRHVRVGARPLPGRAHPSGEVRRTPGGIISSTWATPRPCSERSEGGVHVETERVAPKAIGFVEAANDDSDVVDPLQHRLNAQDA